MYIFFILVESKKKRRSRFDEARQLSAEDVKSTFSSDEDVDFREEAEEETESYMDYGGGAEELPDLLGIVKVRSSICDSADKTQDLGLAMADASIAEEEESNDEMGFELFDDYKPLSKTEVKKKSLGIPERGFVMREREARYSPTSPTSSSTSSSPTSSVYSPTSPAYSPTTPAYSPNFPSLLSNFPSLHPNFPSHFTSISSIPTVFHNSPPPSGT